MDAFEKFLEKARERHGDRYDYSQVNYADSMSKVCIICPDHGEFWQSPSAHSRGRGCPVCANTRRGKPRMTIGPFVERALEVHGGKYSYEKSVWAGSNSKICITCPEHGDFWQLPYAHLNGQGCPKCAGIGLSQRDVIDRFRSVHGDKYDYSNVSFASMKSKVCITCPEHGDFWQTPQKHIAGQGCPKCSLESRGAKRTVGFDVFAERARSVHGDKYQYHPEGFKDQHTKARITCPKHGDFWQMPYDHLNGHGCPKCGMVESRGEDELYMFVCSIVGSGNVVRNDRSILDGMELDIYIPSLAIAIEYDGCWWHSEAMGKGRSYHLKKTELCASKGIRLVHVFEDEYLYRKDIVLSKIAHILGCSDGLRRVYGRKCTVRGIPSSEAKTFLETNHVQGFAMASVHMGCFDQDGSLVGVMSFRRTGDWKYELSRFATDIGTVGVGVGGKLLSHFIDEYNPLEIKTFADRRWTSDKDSNLYTVLGFSFDGTVPPDYSYIVGSSVVRRHKFGFRKRILARKHGLPMTMTESEMCREIGAVKVWDCGKYRYVWKK